MLIITIISWFKNGILAKIKTENRHNYKQTILYTKTENLTQNEIGKLAKKQSQRYRHKVY
jgi:hypothetical protein